MSSTIQFKIRGNRPPFTIDLRESSVDGTIIQTVNLSETGTTEFVNVPTGNYFIVASDDSQTTSTYSVSVSAPPTTTTTTTTTSLPYTFYVVGASTQVNKSTNGGQTWIDVSPVLPDTTLNSSSFVNDVGYVIGNNRKLYKTTNGATSWTDISSAISAAPLNDNCVFAINENTVLVGTNSSSLNYYRSTNGGASFTSVAKGLSSFSMSKFEFTDANVGYTLFHNPNGNITIVGKTTNGGLNWSTITGSVLSKYKTYYDISFYKNTGYLVAGDTIYKTSTGTNDWATIPMPLDMTVYAVKALTNTIVIVAGTKAGSSSENKIAKSTDGGSTWTITTIPSAGNGLILTSAYKGKAMEFYDDGTGLFPKYGIIPLIDNGGLNKTLYTTNAGDTWNFGGSTLLTYPDQFWDIKAKRLPLSVPVTTTSTPTSSSFSWSTGGGTGGKLIIKKNGNQIVNQSTSSTNANGSFTVNNGDQIEITGQWTNGSGNEVKYRICKNDGELAYYDKIGIVPESGWNSSKTHLLTYYYGTLGIMSVNLKAGGNTPNQCINFEEIS